MVCSTSGADLQTSVSLWRGRDITPQRLAGCHDWQRLGVVTSHELRTRSDQAMAGGSPGTAGSEPTKKTSRHDRDHAIPMMYHWTVIGYPEYSFPLAAFKEEGGDSQLIGSNTTLPTDTYQDGDCMFIIFPFIYPCSCNCCVIICS